MSENGKEINILNFLDGPAQPPLPPSKKMVDFGLDILTHSSIGIELYEFVRDNNVKIRIIQGPEERSYAASKDEVVIILRAANPANPSRFILLLTGAIRELMQEHEGMELPPPSRNEEHVLEQMRIKDADKITYMCGVAYEINEISGFHNYHIIDELENMGYSKDWKSFKDALYQYKDRR